ncbi:MAG: hypothetical protein AB7V08_01555 [Elusimicrobiales bacterium]
MAFKRFLNQTAFDKAQLLKDSLFNWQSTPGSIVHLRPNNTVAFYYMGQKALELGELGSTQEYTRIFGRQPEKGVSAEALAIQLKKGRRAVLDHVAKNKMSGQEPVQQAQLAWELLRKREDFTVVDEQVQVPQEALADKSQEANRVDLLLLEKATGQLLLLNLEFASSPDLDGAAMARLKAARALPAALKGGEAIFTKHYQQLLDQKTALGVLNDEPMAIKGFSPKCLLIIGQVYDAYGRLACLQPADLPEGAQYALLGAVAPLKAAAFAPLIDLLEKALTSPRAAYLPRKPRVNDFTRLADTHQAAWAALPKLTQPGAFDNQLTDYSKKNGLALHARAKNPRSSQTACAQALAPVFMKNETAIAGLIAAINANAAPTWGVNVKTVEDCHFEVPHKPTAGGEKIFPKADLAALTGETGRSGGLEAALAVTGERDGAPVRALIGIKFKYTESEFGVCAGFTDPAYTEPGRHACLENGERGALCQLRHAHNLIAFNEFNLDGMFGKPNPLDGHEGACLFAGPVNQLYRSHFTLLRLKEQFGFDEALLLVVYDNRNTSLTTAERPSPENQPLQGPMERYRLRLAPEHKPGFAALPVQAIIEAYAAGITKKTPPWLAKIRSRYQW